MKKQLLAVTFLILAALVPSSGQANQEQIELAVKHEKCQNNYNIEVAACDLTLGWFFLAGPCRSAANANFIKCMNAKISTK